MTIIYIDWNTGVAYDAYGAQYANRNELQSYLDTHEAYEIHYVIDGGTEGEPSTWTPFTGLEEMPVASRFAVDNDFISSYEAKLTEDIAAGAAVTQIDVTVDADERFVPKTGFLILRNAAGEEESFAYSARAKTDGGYTFTLDEGTSAEKSFASGNTVAVPQALMVLAEGDQQSNPNFYVDDSRKNEGIFTVHWWDMSDKIMSFFDFENSDSMSVTAEHVLLSGGDIVRMFQFSVTLKKPISFRPAATVPEVNKQGIANQDWVLSLMRGGMERQYSADGKNDWHGQQTDEDRYYRERPELLAGEWGEAIKLVSGPAGKIVSVSAVALESGAEPTVSNNGTETEAVLVFGLSPGPVGEAAGFGTPTAVIEGLESGANPQITVTASGENTAKVFEFIFKIPAGPVGATPQIAVGTVTTGDTPSVDIAGTDKNPVLNFVLPRGETGFLDMAEILDPDAAGYESGSVVTWGSPVETYQVVIATTTGETPANAAGKFHKLAGAGERGPEGPSGTTFFPSVSVEGVISWSNDGDKQNPASVNIRGPAGYYFTPEVSSEGVLSFTNNGNLDNPPPVRVKGVTFTPSVSADGIISFTNDGGLDNPLPISIKGPAGTGINPKGVWNENATYAQNDMVRGNSATWISKNDNNTGNALPDLPTEENEYWYLNQKDGSVISDISKTGTSGLVDSYTISTNLGISYSFSVTNGRGISTIAKTSTSGKIDTYTISFNDGSSTTFTVTNGTDGTNGSAATIEIVDTETLAAGSNASFEELSGSTAQARKYKAKIPKGADGTNGTTPTIDAVTKHWKIGSTDTGVIAEGKDGASGILLGTITAVADDGTVTATDTAGTEHSGLVTDW